MTKEGVTKINPYRCLDNLDFQSYLQRIGVLNTGDLTESRWGETEAFRNMSRPQNGRKLIAALGRAPGYIHPYDSLAKEVYGCSDKAEIDGVGDLGWAIKSEKKISDPSSLFHARVLGLGLGIEKFGLSPNDLVFLFSLWQNHGMFVGRHRLAVEVTGKDTPGAINTIVKVRTKVNARYLSSTSITVEYAHMLEDGYYRLSSEKDVDKKVSKSNLDYLERPYQEWLMNEAGVITQNDLLLNDNNLILKDGVVFSDEEERVAREMLKFQGGVIPYSVVLKKAYGRHSFEESDRAAWDLAYSMRSKLKNPDDLFVLRDVGWGVGIKEITLAKRELVVLRQLWGNYDRFTSLASLAKRLYGATEETEKVTHSLGALKNHFEGHSQTIGYAGHAQEPAYILTDRSKIAA